MDADGLRNLLEFFKKRNDDGKFVGGLLYFSTSEIYGDPDPSNIPTSEDYREMFHALVLEHAMTNQNDMGKLYV